MDADIVCWAGISGGAHCVYRAQSQELLCRSHLSDFVCRRRDRSGAHGSGSAIGTWVRSIYVALVIVVGVVAHAVFRSCIFAGELSPYQKALGFKPPEIEHHTEWSFAAVVCRRVWLAGDGGKIAKGIQQPSRRKSERAPPSFPIAGRGGGSGFLRPALRPAQAISKHNSYWMWGPGKYDGSTMIILRSGGRDEPKLFQSVEAVGRVEHPYSRRDEYFDIYLCRGLNVNLQDVWPG